MSRRSKILIAIWAGLLVLVLILINLPRTEREPTFEGRTIGQWVFIYAGTDSTSPEHRQAATAIVSIGTNGIPFLLKSIREARPTVGEPDLANAEALGAAAAFGALGSLASGAVPELTVIMNDGAETASACAAHALGRMGKSGIQPLITALQHPKPKVRKSAADFMIFAGADAVMAIPALERIQEDPDANVRKAVALILGILRRKDATNAPPSRAASPARTP